MTIDYLSSRATTSLVLPSKPTFYPQAKIDFQHYQLKHRISIRDSDTIYFCSGYDIYALHTGIQRRELVKSLPWKPKCLDAGYGWICVGGDDGQCAFLHLATGQDGPSLPGLRQRAADVDERLMLGLEPTSRAYVARELQFSRSASNNDRYDLSYHTLGEKIVNSVSIYRMKSTNKDCEDETVVLATNNDKTVQMFSLSQSKPLVTLTYVTEMNHASISPDGNLIVAVGDKSQAFFHKRIPFENSSQGDKTFMTYGWMAIGDPLLRQPSGNCFSTGFSPSGNRCVVVSEGGIITVFDTSLINEEMEDEDAVICIMKTSRPSTRELMGAARSMSFSPSPWDLLAIAEDQGRVIVLDLRNPEFLFRQTLELSVDPSDVVLAECSNSQTTTRMDFEHARHDMERRLLESSREAMELQERFNAMADSTDELEHTIERQNSEADLLGREVQALVQIGDEMHDRGSRGSGNVHRMQNRFYPGGSQSHHETTPSSTTTNNNANAISALNRLNELSTYSDMFSDGRSDIFAAGERIDRIAAEFQEMSSSVLAGRDHPSRSSASILEYVQQRNIERERQRLERQRTSDRQPRRRSSVVITNSNNRNATTTRSTLAPIGTATPTLSTSPSRMPSSSTSTSPAPVINPNESMTMADLTAGDPPEPRLTVRSDNSDNVNNPFAAQQAAQQGLIAAEASTILARARRQSGLSTLRRSASVSRSLGASGATNDPRVTREATQPLLSREDIALLERSRDRVVNNVRDWGRDTTTILAMARDQSRAGGVLVQGVGWSQDGRSLFVATENGLLEYKVNIRERMQWPGVGFV